jgi:hypothetical protein
MLTLARIGVGATIGAWLLQWRRYRRQAAERAEIERFEALIAGVSDDDLSKLHDSFQMLTALECNQQFRRKRDACLVEMERRATLR